VEKDIIASFWDVDPYSGAIKVHSTRSARFCAYLRDTITEYFLPYPLFLIHSNLHKKIFGVWTNNTLKYIIMSLKLVIHVRNITVLTNLQEAFSLLRKRNNLDQIDWKFAVNVEQKEDVLGDTRDIFFYLSLFFVHTCASTLLERILFQFSTKNA